MTTKSDILQHPFCIFTDQIYSYAKARDLLCDLQRCLSLNPNIILFCCWIAKTGQKQLTKKDMRNLIEAVLSWHEQIVLALEKVRKSTEDTKIQKMILQSEIRANHLEQVMLSETIIKTRFIRSILQQSTDAYKNIDVYCKVMRVTIVPEDADMINNFLAIIFPA